MTGNKSEELPHLKTGGIDYEQLYEATIQQVYYVIIRLVINQDTANDLTQDTYTKGFQNLDQLQNRTICGFRSWIIQIAFNQAKDYLKKCKPLLFSDITSDEQGEFEIEDLLRYEQPDVVLNHKILTEEIQCIMSTLPEDQRLCIFLFYYADMTIVEIAQSLELSESTIKSRLKYGRDKIKGCIQSSQRNGVPIYSFTSLPLFVFALKESVLPTPAPLFSSEALLQPKKTKTKLKRNLAIKIVLSIASIAVVATTVYSFYSPGTEEVRFNPFDYLQIEFNGWQGEGTAVLSIDENDKHLTRDSYSIDTNHHLSNGDIIHVIYNTTNSSDNEIIEEVTKPYTVSGLKEKQVINPFDYLNVNFQGENNNGVLDYDWQESDALGDTLHNLNISASKDKDLRNGDIVTITISEPSNTHITFNQIKKNYIVDQLFEKKDEEQFTDEDTVEKSPVLNPYTIVMEEMQKELQIEHIRLILSSLSRDYIGNTLDNELWQHAYQRNQTISVGRTNEIYFGYAEVELVNKNNDVLTLHIASEFNEGLSGKTSIYATCLEGENPLAIFKEMYFGEIELIYE